MKAYYAWLKRYEAEGFDGLMHRSSAPHHSPTATATDAEVVEKITRLRQQTHFGAEKDHDIFEAVSGPHDQCLRGSGGS